MHSHNHLTSLIGKLVRVNRGGPESSEGLLLVAKSNYIVLYIKHEGIVYYNIEHIKSITLIKKPIKHFDKHGQHRQITRKYVKPTSFIDALRSKKNRLVKINRGGPDSITGVLAYVHPNYIKVIDHEETVIIFTHHIKSFSTSLRLVNQLKVHKHAHKHGKDEKENGKENKENNKDQKDNKDQS